MDRLCTSGRTAAESRRKRETKRSIEPTDHEERRDQINAANHEGDPPKGTAAFAAAAPRHVRSPSPPQPP